MDATAVIPLLKVKGNRLIGLASEEEVVLNTAEDIINIVKDENNEKEKLANAFLLAPLQEHIPPFILAISPVYKGQNHALVRHWFNKVLLWAGRKNMVVVGLGADGDSKVRKYSMDQFKRRHGENNAQSINQQLYFNRVAHSARRLISRGALHLKNTLYLQG